MGTEMGNFQRVIVEQWLCVTPKLRIEYTQDGNVNLTGDLGAFQAFWGRDSRGHLDIRTFFLQADAGYIADKLRMPTHERCAQSTWEIVRETICRERRDGELGSDAARKLWNHAKKYLESGQQEDISQWLLSTSLDYAWDYIGTKPTSKYTQFKSAWAEFQADLEEDISVRPWKLIEPEVWAAEQEAQAAYTNERNQMLAELETLSPENQPPPWDVHNPPASWEEVEWPAWIPERVREKSLRRGWSNDGPKLVQQSADSPYNGHYPMGAVVVSREGEQKPRYKPGLWGWYLPNINNMGLVITSEGSVYAVASYQVQLWKT